MVVRLFRKVLLKSQPLLYPLIKRYYNKERTVTKRGISFQLRPTVFHPSLYQSTDLLLDFALSKAYSDRTILELGCGSGFVSMYLAKHTHNRIIASDINPEAVAALKENAAVLGLPVEVRQSDLLVGLSTNDLDIVLINPPYYPKNPTSNEEKAFLAGEDLSYFSRLFQQLNQADLNKLEVFFVLSENVPFELIRQKGEQAKIFFEEKLRKDILGETFFIQQLISKPNTHE